MNETDRLQTTGKNGEVRSRRFAPAFSFALTAAMLGCIQYFLPRPLLLVERYFSGFGWVQVFVMALYAAWLTGKFMSPAIAAKWRGRIWMLFSLVFFSQLLLGLAGLEKMLMTGKLHLPVPALIIAGPLYRGGDFFMLILFFVTVLLVGPAWCSHLCYVGAWDNWFSRARQRPGRLPAYAARVRLGVFLGVVALAVVLRYLQLGWLPAVMCGAIFGLVGVAVMVFISRRNGVMTHCSSFCPLGLLGNWLGRLSLFKIRIGEGCVECQACQRACRYNALNLEDIRLRRPGSTCTLCGDCLSACHSGQIFYYLPGFSPQLARSIFIALVISLHAIFLAVARI